MIGLLVSDEFRGTWEKAVLTFILGTIKFPGVIQENREHLQTV
jgi:hypothetical protein